jgi:3-dehydro-4-phosphotetronate decarboxylase
MPTTETTAALPPRVADDLAAAGRRVIAKGLTWGTSGNISVRIDDAHFAISASGSCLDQLSPETIVACEIDGDGWQGDGRPSVETGMHRTIFQRRPDVGAVLHTSPFHTTLVACSAIELDTRAMTDTVYYLPRATRVPFYFPGTSQLAEAAGEAAAAHDVLLLQNHGALVAAPSLASAVNVTEVLEYLCRMLVAREHGFPLDALTAEQANGFLRHAGVAGSV